MKILKCLGYLSDSRCRGRIKILMCLSYNCTRAVLKVYLECLSALLFIYFLFKKSGTHMGIYSKTVGYEYVSNMGI